MKSYRKQLDKKCLSIWAKIVKSKQVCAMTGKTQSSLSPVIFHAHHIISRGFSAGKYRTDNGLCLWENVHIREKAEPENFHEKILETIGENTYNDLKTRYSRICKISTPELEDIYQGLKKEYNEINPIRHPY